MMLPDVFGHFLDDWEELLVFSLAGRVQSPVGGWYGEGGQTSGGWGRPRPGEAQVPGRGGSAGPAAVVLPPAADAGQTGPGGGQQLLLGGSEAGHSAGGVPPGGHPRHVGHVGGPHQAGQELLLLRGGELGEGGAHAGEELLLLGGGEAAVGAGEELLGSQEACHVHHEGWLDLRNGAGLSLDWMEPEQVFETQEQVRAMIRLRIWFTASHDNPTGKHSLHTLSTFYHKTTAR